MEFTLAHSVRPSQEGQSAPIEARRCYLTVLFCDLCDSTSLSASLEAEDYAEMLAGLRHLCQSVVARYGGTVVRLQGDGMLAVFGHPDPKEGDGRRATEAALDLHRLIRDLPVPQASAQWPSLRLHSGIHSGMVLVQQGDLVLGRLELLGNVPNIASRLSDAAARDEIIVSEETLGPESHFFETSSRRLVSLAGRAEPIGAYTILGRAQVHTRYEARTKRGLSPFIGRQAELRALEEALDQVLAGGRRHVAISAAPGVGKTRLAQEFLQLAAGRGCRVLKGYCESHLSAEPMQPFLQMLRGCFGLGVDTSAAEATDAVMRQLAEMGLREHGPELLRALSFSGQPGGEAAKRPAVDSLMAALKALFAGLAARGPLVVFVDDWQWADAASGNALSAILSLDGAALLALVATRGFETGNAAMNGVDIIELAPFSEHEAAESIGGLLPRVDPFVSAEISRYSGGNPLFIEELCHSAAHEDMDRRLVRLHGGAAWLNVLIESRVARLPAAQAELVRTAAVIGNVVPAWLLHELTGHAEDHPLVRELAHQDFVFPGETPGTLRFKHGITRDVVYDAVGLHTRRALHLRIAEALRRRGGKGIADEAYEALAYHYGAGGHAMDAARYAELAGDKAVTVSALDRAKAQYRAALNALDAAGAAGPLRSRWLAVANKLGLVCVFDAARPDLEVFRRAVALARDHDDRGALARAEYWMGYVSYALSESREAIRHCESALAAAQDAGDDPLAVQIRATLGQVRTAACDYDGALPLLDEAIAVKRRHRSGSRPAVGLAFSLVCRAWVLGDRGDFAAAGDCFDEALSVVPEATHHEIGASIHGWRCAVLLWQGRWADARLAGAESTRIAEQTRSLYQFAMGRAMTAYADHMLGGAGDALHRLQQATAWLEPRDGSLFQSLNHGWLADALASGGGGTQLRRHAARALERGRRGDLLGAAMACRALARTAARAGDRPRAERCVERAMRVAQARGSAHEAACGLLCAAEVACAFGDPPRGFALLDRALGEFERMAMPWHAARCHDLLAGR